MKYLLVLLFLSGCVKVGTWNGNSYDAPVELLKNVNDSLIAVNKTVEDLCPKIPKQQ